MDYNSLTDLQIDVLREIGNIGAGNAATALSAMLERRVDMSVPQVRMVDFKDMAGLLGGPENQVVGILFGMQEEIQGMMMFILEKQFARLIIRLLYGREAENSGTYSGMELSALQEMGNIMAGSYISAISGLTNLKIRLSVPSIAIDMAGAILSVPAVQFGSVGDQVMFIQGDYTGGGEQVTGYLLLIPDIPSLNRILQVLGMAK